MSPVPEDPTPPSWLELRETFAGFFTASARGLLASDFALLDRGGRELGSLRVHEQEGALLEAGRLGVKIERATPSRYTMLAGNSEILSAGSAGGPGVMNVRCGGRPYAASLSLLRNTADARMASGETVARITGGFGNRRYEAFFDAEDECSLPVAVFLLFRLVTLRRSAYRTVAR